MPGVPYSWIARNFASPTQIYCLAPYTLLQCIVHWLPNKRFAWLQSCEGFVNMAPGEDPLKKCTVCTLLKIVNGPH
jgi:hypothetical protein